MEKEYTFHQALPGFEVHKIQKKIQNLRTLSDVSKQFFVRILRRKKQKYLNNIFNNGFLSIRNTMDCWVWLHLF